MDARLLSALCRADESSPRGRQKRVVLISRRWDQVGGDDPLMTVAKKARTPGRARYTPLKPLRREVAG
jgi:hypothetical protein